MDKNLQRFPKINMGAPPHAAIRIAAAPASVLLKTGKLGYHREAPWIKSAFPLFICRERLPGRSNRNRAINFGILRPTPPITRPNVFPCFFRQPKMEASPRRKEERKEDKSERAFDPAS